MIWPSKVQVLRIQYPKYLKQTTHQLIALLTAKKYFAKIYRHYYPRAVYIPSISITTKFTNNCNTHIDKYIKKQKKSNNEIWLVVSEKQFSLKIILKMW